MPGSGGSYRYLREIYGPNKLGRLMSFLFIWQLTFSAPLSMASGSIGLSNYASYIWPSLAQTFLVREMRLDVPILGQFSVSVLVTAGTFVAIGTCVCAVTLLYRKITIIGKLSGLLWVGVMGTVLWVIVSGILNFDSARAFDFPADAFTLSPQFLPVSGLRCSFRCTTGILQCLLFWRRGEGPGAHDTASGNLFDPGCCCDLRRNEHQYPWSNSVAGAG
jgi:amino acid transporter